MAATRAFLDTLDAAEQPVPLEQRVLGALGPKMLELSAQRASGAHPYLVSPDHTAGAREILGEGPLLLPEQGVILCDSAAEARAIGTDWLSSASLSDPSAMVNRSSSSQSDGPRTV